MPIRLEEDQFFQKIMRSVSTLSELANQADIFTCVAEELLKFNQTSDALSYLEQSLNIIESLSDRDRLDCHFLLCDIAKQFYQAGEHERAQNLLSEAFQQAETLTVEDEDSGDYAFIHVAEVYAEMGSYDRAIEIGLMVKDKHRAFFHLFMQMGDTLAELEDHERVLQIASIFESEDYKDWFLQEMTDSYFHYNQMEQALTLLSKISSFGAKADVLTTFAQKYQEMGLTEQTTEFLVSAENEALKEENLMIKVQSLQKIAEQYAQEEKLESARRILSQAQQLAISMPANNPIDQIPRNVILEGISRIYSQINQEEESLKTTEEITGSDHQASHLTNIAQENASEQLQEKARQSLSQAEQDISSETSSHIANLQRVRIVEGWAKLGDLDKARELAETIDEEPLKYLAYSYAGIDISDHPLMIQENLSKICQLASEQTNFEEGLHLLEGVLERIKSLEERFKNYFLTRIIASYFSLLKATH